MGGCWRGGGLINISNTATKNAVIKGGANGDSSVINSNITSGGTGIKLNTLGLSAYGTHVSSSILNGITLTGSLDLALSSELIGTYASEDPFSITFAGLNSENASSITVSQEMVDKFGALTYTKGAEATTLSFAGTGGDAVPEPTTATLSLLALAGLAARRRRK